MVRRIFDLLLSSLILLILSPFFVLLAACIKRGSKGPLFEESLRVGQNGKLMTCRFFRTTTFDVKQEITPIGSWLKKTYLDKLPLLWNIFLGELSFMGRRPITLEEADLMLKNQEACLLSLKPGLVDFEGLF